MGIARSAVREYDGDGIKESGRFGRERPLRFVF